MDCGLRIEYNALINWNPDPPPPPTPGLYGAMWGISMVFEGMVSPWGWGISQDLLSIFMAVHGSRTLRAVACEQAFGRAGN